MGMAPIDLDVGMLGPWGVALLGGVALSEWVWPCWRKCVTVGAGFEVSYAQALPSVEDISCCLWISM